MQIQHSVLPVAASIRQGVRTFLNGNKRTGYELMKVFLEMNGYGFEPSVEDAYRFLLQIAKGKASAKDAEAWIARNLTE